MAAEVSTPAKARARTVTSEDEDDDEEDQVMKLIGSKRPRNQLIMLTGCRQVHHDHRSTYSNFQI